MINGHRKHLYALPSEAVLKVRVHQENCFEHFFGQQFRMVESHLSGTVFQKHELDPWKKMKNKRVIDLTSTVNYLSYNPKAESALKK